MSIECLIEGEIEFDDMIRNDRKKKPKYPYSLFYCALKRKSLRCSQRASSYFGYHIVLRRILLKFVKTLK